MTFSNYSMIHSNIFTIVKAEVFLLKKWSLTDCVVSYFHIRNLRENRNALLPTSDNFNGS